MASEQDMIEFLTTQTKAADYLGLSASMSSPDFQYPYDGFEAPTQSSTEPQPQGQAFVQCVSAEQFQKLAGEFQEAKDEIEQLKNQ